ncbi:MAG TPA: N-acetylneuraminate synthase family protein, partial [Candidatus Parcubacteria bacterium]|nr:N-acetylneuraminate synthase family protein [Candidatus Parcubacteria bacterium]
LFDYCKKKDILFISTSYDVESAKFLNRLGVRVFKIASADIIDIPLHEYVASTKKPTIISVGMATLDEIKKTLNIYRKYKNRNAILLHCTSNYPASYKSLNLKVINTLQKEFDILVGYSDHSLKNYAGIISTALGSRVIEKHFTLDRAMPGPDHKASMEPDELKEFIKDIRLTELILGNGKKTVQLEEKSMKQISRKSLVANEEIKKGQIIKKEMLTLKRPGTGLKWEERKQIIGKRARKNISKDQLITINLTK